MMRQSILKLTLTGAAVSLPKPRALRGALLLLLPLLHSAFAAEPLLAQVPSQTLPSAPAAAPNAATFKLQGVTFKGATAVSQADLAALARPYIGRDVTLGDLEQVAKQVSDLYHARGYFLAQALVPAQTVRNGTVELSVVEGKLGKIDVRVADDAPLTEARARAFLAVLKPGEPLNAARYERAMLLLSDQPGIKVASGLQQGIDPGTSDLIVDITAGRRWSFAADADNFGTTESGRVRVGGTARLNSPFRIGDNIDVRLMLAQNNSLNFGRLAYEAPLGADGLRLGVGASRVSYALGGNLSALGADGTAVVVDASLNYPLFRERTQNLFLRGGVDHKTLDDNLSAFAFSSNKRVDGLNLGWAWERRDAFGGGGYWASSGTLYQGRLAIGNDQSRVLDQDPASGHHTDGNFTKVSAQVSRLQAILARHSLYFSLGAQLTNANLDASEKLALGGARAVRALSPNELLVDDGVIGSVEWRWSATDDLTPYVFYDAGRGKLWHNPLSTDVNNSRSLQGYGVGLAWSRPGNFSVNASLGWRSNNTTPVAGNESQPRINFQAQKLF